MIRCVLSSDPFWCTWGLLPLWAQWGLVGCVLLMLGGFAWRLVSLARSLGGWPAAVGALGVVGILAAVIAPRPREQDEQFPHPDGEPQHPRAKPEKKVRESIFRRPGESVQSWLDRVTKSK